jgi:hypothetical protein
MAREAVAWRERVMAVANMVGLQRERHAPGNADQILSLKHVMAVPAVGVRRKSGRRRGGEARFMKVYVGVRRKSGRRRGGDSAAR